MESNIRLAADRTIDDGEIQSLLDKYDLSEFKNKRVNLLSGGEKQRVSLIRALIKILDWFFAMNLQVLWIVRIQKSIWIFKRS